MNILSPRGPDERAVLAVTITALGLRLFQLGAESIWIDEWTSVTLARSSIVDILQDRSQSVNAPLYFLLLHVWCGVFGDSEFAIRLPSALWGTASVALVFLVGRELFDRSVGIGSAILVATSMFHIRHSQEARGYTLMVALSLLSIYCFLRLPRGGRRVAVGYVVASGLLLYTHFYGLLIVAAQNLHMLWRAPADQTLTVRRWLGLQLAVLALFAPWSIFFVLQLVTIQSGFWIPEPTLDSLKETFLVYSNDHIILLVAFGCLALLGLTLYRRDRAHSVQLLCLVIATTILVPFVVSTFSTPVYYTRYTIVASAAFLVLVSAGIQRLPFRPVRIAVLWAVVAISAAQLGGYYREQTNAPWRELAGVVDGEARPTDLVLFNDSSYEELVRGYYSSRKELHTRGFNVSIGLQTERSSDDSSEQVEDLDSITATYRRVWLVLYKSNDPEGAIKRRLGLLRREISHRMFGGIEVYVFE